MTFITSCAHDSNIYLRLEIYITDKKAHRKFLLNKAARDACRKCINEKMTTNNFIAWHEKCINNFMAIENGSSTYGYRLLKFIIN